MFKMATITAELETIGTNETSQELFQEVLRTVPVDVEYAELSFLAHGILDPGYNEEGDMQRYIKECSERGVMPFSQVKLKWNRIKGFPDPSTTTDFLAVYGNYDSKTKEIATDRLLEGGKIHNINVETENFHFDFEDFQKGLLERILRAEYEVGKVDLWLSTCHLTGYNEGTYRESGLTMGRGRRGFELQIERFPDAEGKRVLVDWFTQLTQKHDAEVYQK